MSIVCILSFVFYKIFFNSNLCARGKFDDAFDHKFEVAKDSISVNESERVKLDVRLKDLELANEALLKSKMRRRDVDFENTRKIAGNNKD